MCERAKTVKGLTSTLVLTCSLPPPTHPSLSSHLFLLPLSYDQSGISVHLWEGQRWGWVISPHPHQKHWLAGAACELLGRYPLSGNINAELFMERQREGAAVRCEWCVLGQEAAQHCANVCEKRCLFHLCQPPLKLPLVWCTGLVSFSSITNDDKLPILWLWSIVCCWTLY